ncbi:MAG: IniB N-terminal domain-containing protein [Mycobacterium sp.]
MNIIDWILDLFRSEDMARAFVAAPEQALRDAGLAGVSAAQLGAVASTAVPGLVLGDGDPIVGLQRAVSNNYGFAPATGYSPANSLLSPSFAPQTNTELASRNNTDLLSGNHVPIASPDQNAGANAQNGAFNLGFGDITFGNKTSNTATDGGVVIDGDNRGDIVTGDGAVLGNNNDVNNGDVLAGTGSNVNIGRGDIDDDSTTVTGGGSVITDNDGPVFQDVDASGGHGGNASGGGSLIGIGGGNDGGNAGGGGIILVDNRTDTTTVGGDQTHIRGDYGSGNSADTTQYTQVETDSSTTVTDKSDNSSSSLFDTDLLSNNDTALSHETSFSNDQNYSSDMFSNNNTGVSTDLFAHNDSALSADTSLANEPQTSVSHHGF